MERIRDFLFDISDLLISLLIIATIFMVISWKLNEAIPIDTSLALQTVETPAPASDSPTPDTDTAPSDSDVPDASEPDKTTDAADADKPITVQPTTPKPSTTAPASGKEITIKIPNGSPGVTIGKILKENSLITDVSAFILKVDELGLGPKLRSGSFTLKTGMNMEDIIKTIANVN